MSIPKASDERDTLPKLPLLFEKHLNHAVHAESAAYCDLHDLIAVVNTTSNDVSVYRAVNGQIVFTAKHSDQDEDTRPSLISWKPDGSLLAVGWDDASCCLYSGEDGKLISRTSSHNKSAESDWRLTIAPAAPTYADEVVPPHVLPNFIAWTAHKLDVAPLLGANSFSALKEGLSTEAWFDEVTEEGQQASRRLVKDNLQALVDSITRLDTTKVLPGLSALPSHALRPGLDAAKFTTQVGVDGAFAVKATDARSVDAQIIGNKSGAVKVFLDDSAEMGTFSVDKPATMHASNSQCAAQVLLSQSESHECELRFMQLPLDKLGSTLLRVVATNTKRLQSLMHYAAHSVRCLQHDFTTGLQLPSRILNGLKEELRDQENIDPATALYELCMTGRSTPVMTEWLTDIVKDTTRKRWEQSLNDMYEHVQTHLFMHVLPALDRISMAAATLRAHAQIHEDTTVFDVPPRHWAQLEDCADSVRLVAHKMLLEVMSESRQFKAFIRWLRVMVEVATAGPGTKSAVETEQRELPSIDIGLAASYVMHGMGDSGLLRYLYQLPGADVGLNRNEFFESDNVKQLGREHTVSAIEALNRKNKTGSAAKISERQTISLSLPLLTARMVAQARLCLEGIAAWQQQIIARRTSATRELSVDLGGPLLDMKMFPPETDKQASITVLLAGPAATDEGRLRLTTVIEGVGGECHASHSDISFGQSAVLHARIKDAQSGLALLRQPSPDENRSDYSILLFELRPDLTRSNNDSLQRTLHVFSNQRSAFTPKQLLLGGRRGKEVVTVFSGNQRSWQVLEIIDRESGKSTSMHKSAHGDSNEDAMVEY